MATKNVCGHRQPPGGELALVWGLGIGTPWPGPGVLATPSASPLGPPGHTAVPGGLGALREPSVWGRVMCRASHTFLCGLGLQKRGVVFSGGAGLL